MRGLMQKMDIHMSVLLAQAKENKDQKKSMNSDLLDATRHALGSINLKDIEDADTLVGETELSYLGKASAIWTNPVFRNEIARIIRLQLEFTGMQASNFEQTIVGRGTINAADLIKSRFENLHTRYLDRTKPKESFDKFEVSA